MGTRKAFLPDRRWALPILMLLLLCLAGCSVGASSGQTPSVSQSFTQLQLGIPAQALSAPVVGVVPAGQVLRIGVTFKLDQQVLQQLAQQPDGQTSTQGVDLTQKLGVDPKIYQQVTTFFQVGGVKVTGNATGGWLSFSAPAGTIAKLLQTSLVERTLNNHHFYTPDMTHPPVIPSILAANILSVSGLDNFSQPQAPPNLLAQSQPVHAQSQADSCASSEYGELSSDDIAHAYGLDTFWKLGLHGEGMKVALIEGYDTYQESDLQTYFHCVGYHGKFSTVTVDNVPSGNYGETTLDIDMLAGLAPAAQITDYQGDYIGAQDGQNESYYDGWVVLNDLLQRVIADNQRNASYGTVMSISMQADESSISQDDLTAIDQSMEILTRAEHISIFGSTGDCGAFSYYTYGSLSVSFPASDPWVVAVGGTVLEVNQSSVRTQESAWKGDGSSADSQCNNDWGSGGGLSTKFAQPTWQQTYGKNLPGLHNTYTDGKRQDADIALDAQDLAYFYEGYWSGGGGTSASTPMAAAGQLLVNEALGKTTHQYYSGPQLYYFAESRDQLIQPFFDVTSGNNHYYPATKGWDYPTGLGVPTYPQLYALLASNLG